MNCEQANQLDMVDYLSSTGHTPQKIRAESYWYLSPLRGERTASFKVDRSKNVWYDHGIGKGGRLVDFICLLKQCSVAQALQELGGLSINKVFSFQEQKKETRLEIVSIKNNLEDKGLRNYLASRRINLSIANRFCKEIHYRCAEKLFTGIGFKNNAGGYELRSPGFKGAVSPKYVSWFDHQSRDILVFEGFFDFLTYHCTQNIPKTPANYLVLNSLSFFTRSLLLMEKHERIHLFLDNDPPGQRCTQEARQRSNKVIDESPLYSQYKDLNEWAVSQEVRKLIQQEHRQSRGLRP